VHEGIGWIAAGRRVRARRSIPRTTHALGEGAVPLASRRHTRSDPLAIPNRRAASRSPTSRASAIAARFSLGV
jgi:hypothetical protein